MARNDKKRSPVEAKDDRQPANARTTLIEAAVEEFARNGYAATTLADIARRAGVTTGAVYAHFSGKLDLLLEALGLRSADKFVELANVAAKLPTAQLTDALAKGLVNASLGHRAQILLDVVVFARRNPEAAKALRRMVAVRQQAFERMTMEGVDAGVIEPLLRHDELARLISGLAFGMLVQRALGERPASTATVAQLAALLLRPTPEDARGGDAHLARVRARAAAAAQAQVALRDAIGDAKAAGASLRKLGAAAGLSHERIRTLLANRDPSS
jgi:AcrR family transcriptional regulator